MIATIAYFDILVERPCTKQLKTRLGGNNIPNDILLFLWSLVFSCFVHGSSTRISVDDKA